MTVVIAEVGRSETGEGAVVSGAMQFGVLGPLEILDHTGERVEVGGPQPRLVLALLLVAGGRAVRADALVDALWGEAPPASASGTLQSYVSRLRRSFDGADDVQLVYSDGSYRLDVDVAQIDAWRFEALAEAGRAHLDAGDAAAARTAFEQAEALWRGPALAEFADHEAARNLAVRLEERRIEATEHRVAADLALGRHAAVVGELSALVAAHPLREGLQAQLALALYRSGRQADALRAIADAGRTLREELGIEPSRALQDLEAAILDQDPSLDAPAATAPAGDGPIAGDGPHEPLIGGHPGRVYGRDPELRQLRSALEEARSDCRFVVLEGDPGIGKTRLADELRTIAEAQGCRALWGRTDEGGAAPALWPWLGPLRALVDVGPVPEPIAALLAGEVTVLAGQGVAVRFELFEAIAGVIERAGGDQPVVLLIDDLQWADEASLELLAFLAGRLGPGVLVVATMRRLEVGRHGAVTDALAALARRRGSRRILVKGLRSGATAEMLDELAPEVASAIHTRAEGNPFYAIELARLVSDDGTLPDDVPGSVGDVVRRRLAGLPSTTAEMLGVAAVQGREIDLALLATTMGTDLASCLDTIEAAVVQRLLEDDPDRVGGLRFSHALVRDVLLDGLTSLRRARLHLAVADAIVARGASRDDAEILAEHLWRAAPVGVGSRAADALEQAAEVAVSRVSYAAAEDLLNRAVRLRQALATGRAEQEAELAALVRLLEITQITRYFQGADHDLVQRAIDLAMELGEVDTHRRLAWYQWAAGATAARVDEGAPLAEAYRARFQEDERPIIRSSAHEVYGVGCWGQGRIGDAVRSLDIAFDLLDGVPPPEDTFGAEQYVVTFTFWLYNHALHGSLSVEATIEGYQQLHDAVPDPVGRASVCGFAMTTFAPLLEFEAIEHFERLALEADPRSQFAFWGGQLQMHHGILAAWKGRVDDGIELFADGRARYMGVGGCSGMHSFEASLAYVLALHGRTEEARVAIDAGRGFLDSRNERWAEPSLVMSEAVVAHAEGDEVLAEAKLHEARAVALRQEAFAMLPRIDSVADDLGIDLGPLVP